jgi:hypothetical protein
MKQISKGNTGYEKTVSAQFIEMIPVQIQELKNAFEMGRTEEMRNIAHDLKTTVAVMGLSGKLDPLLNEIEYCTRADQGLEWKINEIRSIGYAALREAQEFHQSI